MTQQEFTASLLTACALKPASHVLMAVSGGADSVAMLCLFASVRESFPLSLSCAHMEHGVRGEDSLEDLAFVRALCKAKGIPLYECRADAPAFARAQGMGLEEAARTLRYTFLEETADAVGAHAVALAHHAGDQAETVLMHASRGSDVRGLGAMRFRRGRFIRPLLRQTPQALRAYLLSIGQSWREDATNGDLAYTRNRMRHDVLPRLESAVPGAANSLCRLALAAQRDEDYFDAQLDALNLPALPLIDGAAMEKEKLLPLHPALLTRQIVRLFASAGLAVGSAREIAEIAGALGRDDAVVNLGGGAHAHIGRRYLCLVRADAPETDVPLCALGITDTPFGRFEVRPAHAGEMGDGRLCQSVPARLLEGARVSGRREGDALVPFGRKTPVKIKKLMIDAGIERAMRKSMPIVRRDDTVLFAVGLRPGECVRGAENEERRMIRFLGEWPGADGNRNKQEENIHD